MFREILQRMAVFSLVVLIALVIATSDSTATTGSINVNPGQTVYVGYGDCGEGWLLLWSLTISTWSTVFSDWLEKPDGTRLSLSSTTWGVVTDMAGEWKLGFSIDASGFWSATVSYDVRILVPSLSISSHYPGSYSKTPSTTISGGYDGSASKVEVSLDNVHFQQADSNPLTKQWVTQVQLQPGSNTIYAKSWYTWGSFAAIYTIEPVTVILDVELPTIVITAPIDGSEVRGGYVDVAWQCSDNTGIAMIEMKIDGWDWNTVSGYEVQDVWLPSGYHVIQIRVTDNAGNQAIDSIGFNSDNRALSFSGPYYGLPVVGIALAIAVVAAILFMRFRRKKGGPTVATVPPEDPAPQVPPASP